MTTLSLLKNVEEIHTLALRQLPIPTSSATHPDMDWIVDEYLKWSQQFAVSNRFADSTVALFFCTGHGQRPTKERVLNALKCSDISFYIDIYLKAARETRSADLAKEIVHKLLEALKTGKCEESFQSGKRFISSIQGMKNDMTAEQWSAYEQMIEEGLNEQLDIHCEYWLKNRFIELDQYVYKRSRESFWTILTNSNEYIQGFPVPARLKSDPKLMEFCNKCVEMNLSVDDYYMAVNKLMTNDMTSRVFSFANDNKCSIQEAIDNQFQCVLEVEDKRKKLMAELTSNETNESFKKYMEAMLSSSHTIFPIVTKMLKIYVKPDQTIGSERWPQMYTDLVNNQSQAMPFDIENNENILE